MVLPKSKSYDTVNNRDLQKLHMGEKNPLNSDVVIYDGRVQKIRLPNRGVTERRFGAEVPPTQINKTTANGETKTHTLGGDELPDLRVGVHPIKQMIFYETHGRGKDEDEIIDLFYEKGLGWFKDEDIEENIKEIIMDMLEENAVIKVKDGRIRSDITEIDTIYDLGEEGYDKLEGVYPIIQLIQDGVIQGDGLSLSDIKDLVERWNWVKDRESIDYWISKMEREGYIEEVRDHYFRSAEKIIVN